MRGYLLGAGFGDGEYTWVVMNTPVLLSPHYNFPHRIRALYPGKSHTIAILMDGSMYGWGENHFGQVGNGQVLINSWLH